jgi:Sulphur transport
MVILLNSLAFIAAALCAGAMGFAIQRGGTCTVAAVDEVIGKRRFKRLGAMAEASLWVAGGLVLAQSLHLLTKAPAGYAVSVWTVVGGALLGLGAFVNGACVFGAIARLGSGEWAYAVTPVGFYAGCVSVVAVFAPPQAQPLNEASPVLQASAWLALPFLVFAAWRLLRPVLAVRSVASAQNVASRVWSPHAATTVIGLAFFFMLLLVGSWAYTEALADLARDMAQSLAAKLALLLAMFVGALWGGWTAGRWRGTRASPAQWLRCFAGGVLMGWGSLLIPGANDGLILIGMPLLRPYAWLGFFSMCISIGAALLVHKAVLVRVATQSPAA